MDDLAQAAVVFADRAHQVERAIAAAPFDVWRRDVPDRTPALVADRAIEWLRKDSTARRARRLE